MGRNLEAYLIEFSSFLKRGGLEDEERSGALEAFLCRFNARPRDRAACSEVYQRSQAELWLELGQRRFRRALELVDEGDFRRGLARMKEVFRPVEEAEMFKGDNMYVPHPTH